MASYVERKLASQDKRLQAALDEANALLGIHEASRAAAGLARLQYEHFREVGEGYELDMRDVAAAAGIDITGWHIEFYEGHYGDPLATAVRASISEQLERLREVAELAPLHNREF